MIEIVAGPVLIVIPFVAGFGLAATLLSVSIGAILIGLALQVEGPRRTVPLSAHALFDYAVALVAVAGGLAVGIATGEWISAGFLVAVGAAQVMLTASTRFSMPRGV